jgi:hypothetical protein
MSRTYTEPIFVRSMTGDLKAMDPAAEWDSRARSPIQFLWRGRLYVVRAVMGHWIESSTWWGGSRRILEGAIPAHEHEIWRVEAQSGRGASAGVYDLCRDVTADSWVLTRSLD